MRECPKCRGRMSEGFVVDSGDYGTATVSTWQGGEPKKSFWTGLKQDKKAQIEITTWRCDRCGFLENYALQQ
jgi:predicted nucleic-acid-binding Zn-ribbon protein